MARLTVTPDILAVVFRVEDAAGHTWEVAVDESWRKSGSGNSTFNTAFDPGSHSATLRVNGVAVQTVFFTVQDVEYVPPKPPEIPKPPVITNPPIEDRTSPQPGGYWEARAASPNDSSRRLVGARFGSYTDCVRSWRSTGSGGDGSCAYVAPPPAPPTESPLGKWVKDTISGLGDFVSKLSESISSLSGRIDALQKGLDGIWEKLEGWLVERLVGLMLRALDMEVEKRGR